MPTVYRVIKFECSNEKTLQRELDCSTHPGEYSFPSSDLKVYIRDTPEDPCYPGFF